MWRSATSPPQPVIGVAATFSSRSRAGQVGRLDTERPGVEQERPGTVRRHGSEAVELPERLVAAGLPLGVRGGEAVVREVEGGADADLRESARDEAVVDVHAGDVVCELARRDDPADAPRDHPLLERRRADRDRAVAHPVERGRVERLAPVEEDALVAGPVEEPEVALAAEPGDRLPLLAARDPAGREGRVVHEDGARAVRRGRRERVEVETPLPVLRRERDEPRDGAGEPHAVQHPRVRRIGEDHLVAGIRRRRGARRASHRPRRS